jgi:diguanylate cyclase (GGDEF)-like protein/PAS domain S-box-containing protein
MGITVLRRLRYWIGSLKLRLALASFVLIAASVAFTVVFVLRDMEDRSQRAVLASESANAERYAALLSSRLVGLQTSLRAATGRLPKVPLTDSRALVRFLEEEAVLRAMFDNVFVLSADGRLLANADAGGIHPGSFYDNPNAADRSYFRLTVQRKRSVVSEPIIGRDSREPAIVVTMPLLDRRGAVVGVLGGGLSLLRHSLVSEVTRERADDRDPVVSIIIDAAGRIVSHPDPSRIFTDARREPRFAAGVVHWTDEGLPIDPQGSSARLGDRVVAFAGVPDADWVVFRSAPAEVLLGGPAAGRSQAAWMGAAVALIGGLVIMLAVFALLRPLRQLERRALRLLDDDLAASEGWPRTGGELGELTRVFRHVMRQRAASRESADALLEKMRAVLAKAPVGIAFVRNNHFELVSAECERLFGREPGSMTGRPTSIIGPDEAAYRAFRAKIGRVFAGGGQVDQEEEVQRADGSRFWARLRGAPLRIDAVDSGTIWIFTDATEARSRREHLSWHATHDPLTRLVNRHEFERRLAEQLHERRETERAAALFIDLDHFKAVNDSAGHAAGDEMLRRIAAIFSVRARADDTVARIGGDEFAVILRGCDRASAERVAHDLCQRVQDCELEHGVVRLTVGASIGVVEIDTRFDTVADVMAAADAACYEAKRGGRNAVRTYRGDSEPDEDDAEIDFIPI